MTKRNNSFQEHGFLLFPRVLTGDELSSAGTEADRLLAEATERGGSRNGLTRSAALRALALSPALLELASSCIGARCKPVKLTVFDKTPKANWKVPWHQDLTITVRERRDVPDFGPWSIKGGLPHVQPPVEVLERLVALRLHLDPTPPENGALRVLPGSHRLGRLTNDEIDSLVHRQEPVVCPVEEGGVMAMSPLLLHASSAAAAPRRRRVLHFEYSSHDLPGGLAWADQSSA